ncbi:unnamed protein product [Sphagnum troendelagicum]|uniref:AAA+ ATPase domain-containing protein n=1 Tax=Sphagnum troendelagicum TaxID=128251 RepID=A0ABP0UR74_9BRYO
MVEEMEGAIRSSLRCSWNTVVPAQTWGNSCLHCNCRTIQKESRHLTFARVKCSKQEAAEDKNQGANKGGGPWHRLRLRGRSRLLLRYMRRSLLLPQGLSWRHILLAGLITCTCGFCAVLLHLSAPIAPSGVPYSQLVENLHGGTVTTVLFEEGTQKLFFNVQPKVHEVIEVPTSPGSEEAVLEQSASSKPSKPVTTAFKSIGKRKSLWQYSTRQVKNDEAYLLSLMREGKVQYSSAPQPVSASLRSLLLTVISLWIPLSPLLWLLHRQISGNNSVSQGRLLRNRLVKFDDVAGIDTAKTELMEIVACLRGASNYSRLGAKLPKGVLLVGPPGTGKTLLARAVAGEAGVPFFAASASEFVEMFVGRGAARIRELFAEARKNTPSIVFIDELDAVGGRRGRSFNDERDQTLNQLLTEMDGFDSTTGVLVLAATNRPEVLDPALCRPGRISRRVNVQAPDLEGRKQVLAVHMRSIPVEQDPTILCAAVASITPGFVGAELANVVNEAALLAARQGRTAVMLEDFREAVFRTKYGVGERPRVGSVVEKQFNQWFSWMSKVQDKSSNESGVMPAGYRTLPFGG